MAAVDVVRAFVFAINTHDIARLGELMTDHHEFVDSLGRSIRGRDAVLAGWRRYFEMCPDYWITHQGDIFSAGDEVGMFGLAGGRIAHSGASPAENVWRTPAAWFARVEGERVALWRVFADNKPVYDILARLGAL
jgi:ketosteroid isomerase-like protein